MKRLITSLVLIAVLGICIMAAAAPKMQLMIYTSMKEVLIADLITAFTKKNPGVQVDYYSAGAGKLMAKIATEKQANALVCDVLWTSEVPDFYQMKNQGALEPYISPEAKNIVSPVKDKDGYFTPARLGTLGVAYNTNKVKNPPKTWDDLLKPEFKGGFAIANPALSGTAMVSVGMIVENLGWEYIQKLRANGALMGQGSGQVVDDTAIGDLKACLGVDYIVINKVQDGASLGFAYLDKMLVIPSPVAILKGTKNIEAAKLFIDFLLSVEGQTLVAGSFTLPIRADVPIAKGVGLVTPAEAEKRAMKLDYLKLMAEKEATIEKFTSIMTK